jgi:hypothetical protein
MTIQELRFKRRLTQWELAILCGFSQGKLSYIERGLLPAKAWDQKSIADKLGVSPEDIEWPTSRALALRGTERQQGEAQ